MADSKKIDDGGPALPLNEKHDDGSHYHSHPGLSLRDWFAGQALAGQLANVSRVGDFAKRSRAAEEAYHWADAMIAARKAGA